MKLDVEGMTCSHCERTITRAVAALGGIARVDLATGTVEVTGVDDVARVRAAIEGEGYKVTAGESVPIPVKVGGHCCGSCHG